MKFNVNFHCLLAILALHCNAVIARAHPAYQDRRSGHLTPQSANVVRRHNPTPPSFGRTDGCADPVKPKVLIVSLFAPEGAVWPGPLHLGAVNVTTPGLSPLYPEIQCDAALDVCQVTASEAEINAASTATALALSPYLDLQHTYVMIAGIAGINPECAGTASVAFARYVVQVGLAYEIDAREKPANWSYGYTPFGANVPFDYPSTIYGTEVFELNVALRDRAISLASRAHLNDSAGAAAYRAQYPHGLAATTAPQVFAGDVTCSDVYFAGEDLSAGFEKLVTVLTNGTGRYCMTAQEDSAIAEALLRAALARRFDFSRLILMRTASDYDRPPPGISAADNLLVDDKDAFEPAVQNIYLAGIEVVNDILHRWDAEYKAGIAPRNYIGDILNSLPGPVPPDFGQPSQFIHPA